MKYAINIVLCLDACKLICLKLGMMLNTTWLYSLIAIGMTLMFTQGHRKARICAVILFQNCMKQSNMRDSWLHKGDDCEEALCGEYG